MTDDFFTEFGETISKTAKDIGTRADSFISGQKIRTKIMAEERAIDRTLEDIGTVIYEKYVNGEPVDEAVTTLCEEITRRKVNIAKYREKAAKMKGRKVCPACGASVPADARFCMKCGAPCEDEEEAPEQEVSQSYEETAEETCEETVAEECQEETFEAAEEEVKEQE